MYITREDIKAAVSLAELIQLTNDIGGSTEPDWAVVDRAIAYACEIADGLGTACGLDGAALGIGRYLVAHGQRAAGFHHHCADGVNGQDFVDVGIVRGSAQHLVGSRSLFAGEAHKTVGHDFAGGFNGGNQDHLFGRFRHCFAPVSV